MISHTKSREAPFVIEEIAKRNGYKIDDYELLKNIVKAKFSDRWNETIRRDLLLTNNKMLIYMNQLHENILGYCFCEKCKDIEKQNIYGKILFDVRKLLFENIKESFHSLEDAKDFAKRIKIKLNIFEVKEKSFDYLKKYFVTNKDYIDDDKWVVLNKIE